MPESGRFVALSIQQKWLGVFGLMVFFGMVGCQTGPTTNRLEAPTQEPTVRPAVDAKSLKRDMERMQEFSSRYGNPTYVNAWSCRSTSDAMRDLTLQLSVNVNASSLSESQRNDLSVHYQTRSRLSTDSVEALHGLIMRRSGPCVFVAIDPKNTRDYYKSMATDHEKEVVALFNQLDQSHSSLVRFHAAKKLEKLLKSLRTEHDAMALFGVKPHRLAISKVRLRRMKQALSFQVAAKECFAYSSAMRAMRCGENGAEEGTISEYLQQKGYTVAERMGDPAFLVKMTINKIVEPVTYLMQGVPYLFSIEASLVDVRSGKVLKRKTLSSRIMADISFSNNPYSDPDATKTIVGDLLDGLANTAVETTADSERF